MNPFTHPTGGIPGATRPFDEVEPSHNVKDEPPAGDNAESLGSERPGAMTRRVIAPGRSLSIDSALPPVRPPDQSLPHLRSSGCPWAQAAGRAGRERDL